VLAEDPAVGVEAEEHRRGTAHHLTGLERSERDGERALPVHLEGHGRAVTQERTNLVLLSVDGLPTRLERRSDVRESPRLPSGDHSVRVLHLEDLGVEEGRDLVEGSRLLDASEVRAGALREVHERSPRRSISPGSPRRDLVPVRIPLARPPCHLLDGLLASGAAHGPSQETAGVEAEGVISNSSALAEA